MKSSKILSFFVFSLISLALLSCQRTEIKLNPESEKPLVEKAIHNTFAWAKTKDINLLYSIIANDSSYVEIDPHNRIIKGFNDFRRNENFWLSPDFKAISYKISDLKINFSTSGKVAWFYCILDDINEWKGQPANWENTRWTGVLEKRNEKWTMVQMHFSFADKSN